MYCICLRSIRVDPNAVILFVRDNVEMTRQKMTGWLERPKRPEWPEWPERPEWLDDRKLCKRYIYIIKYCISLQVVSFLTADSSSKCPNFVCCLLFVSVVCLIWKIACWLLDNCLLTANKRMVIKYWILWYSQSYCIGEQFSIN